MEHKRIIAICAPLILFFVMAHADDGDGLAVQALQIFSHGGHRQSSFHYFLPIKYITIFP